MDLLEEEEESVGSVEVEFHFDENFVDEEDDLTQIENAYINAKHLMMETLYSDAQSISNALVEVVEMFQIVLDLTLDANDNQTFRIRVKALVKMIQLQSMISMSTQSFLEHVNEFLTIYLLNRSMYSDMKDRLINFSEELGSFIKYQIKQRITVINDVWSLVIYFLSKDSLFNLMACSQELYTLINDTYHFKNLYLVHSGKSEEDIIDDQSRSNDCMFWKRCYARFHQCNLLYSVMDEHVHIWDANTGTLKFKFHAGTVYSAFMFVSDENEVISVLGYATNGMIKIFRGNELCNTYHTDSNPITLIQRVNKKMILLFGNGCINLLQLNDRGLPLACTSIAVVSHVISAFVDIQVDHTNSLLSFGYITDYLGLMHMEYNYKTRRIISETTITRNAFRRNGMGTAIQFFNVIKLETPNKDDCIIYGMQTEHGRVEQINLKTRVLEKYVDVTTYTANPTTGEIVYIHEKELSKPLHVLKTDGTHQVLNLSRVSGSVVRLQHFGYAIACACWDACILLLHPETFKVQQTLISALGVDFEYDELSLFGSVQRRLQE